MDGMYCCSYMRFTVRACIVAAVVGLVLFAAVSLAGAQTRGEERGGADVRGMADDGCLHSAADGTVTVRP